MNCDFDCEAFNRYHVDLPYPDVTVEKQNTLYARLVSGIFAGKGSEATAIAQYGMHRFYLDEYPDAFTAYRYIAAVEMTHFELLGRLVKALGFRPLLYAYDVNRFWSGRNPDYQYALRQILNSDIQGEKDAIAHYQRLIRQIDDEGIRALFRRIILDEEKHIEVLNGLYEQYIRTLG